jgi:hypothetical protein
MNQVDVRTTTYHSWWVRSIAADMSNTARDRERYADPSGEKMEALVWMGKNSVEVVETPSSELLSIIDHEFGGKSRVLAWRLSVSKRVVRLYIHSRSLTVNICYKWKLSSMYERTSDNAIENAIVSRAEG